VLTAFRSLRSYNYRVWDVDVAGSNPVTPTNKTAIWIPKRAKSGDRWQIGATAAMSQLDNPSSRRDFQLGGSLAMPSIVNQSRYLVTVKGRPDLTREFVHAKAAQAQAYKDQVLTEHGLTAQIERGPLQLLVRLRVRGQPTQSKRVTSYEAAEEFELAAQVDQNRGLAIDYNRSHRVTLRALMTRYMREEWRPSPARIAPPRS
jgi:hypothetical protein